MSCLAIIRTKNEFVWATDTATSVKYQGELYRLGDDFQKISIIDGKLIFCAGSDLVIPRVLMAFRYSSDQSVDNLARITKFLNEKYGGSYCEQYGCKGIDVTFGFFRDGQTVLYNIIPDNCYVPTLLERDKGDCVYKYAAGFRSDEFNNNVGALTGDVLQYLQRGYDSVACEGVGGHIIGYHMDQYGIRPLPILKINEPAGLRRFPDSLRPLIKTLTPSDMYESVADYFRFTAGEISSNRPGVVVPGNITSNATISVATDAIVGDSISVGESVILRWESISGGIRWGSQPGAPAIYYNAADNELHISAYGARIYANGQRIDAPPVAVFG